MNLKKYVLILQVDSVGSKGCKAGMINSSLEQFSVLPYLKPLASTEKNKDQVLVLHMQLLNSSMFFCRLG